ncbi:MAG: response regulator [Proteobacteria bacterium]|nr:response regulator [Pseudomonadota bacterium]
MHAETNQKIRILIVDDDENIADILKDIVSAEGRTVDACHDGLSAIERIQNIFYDLIIVDLVIPRVGGLDVLRYAKKANPNVLVIIITGYASIETAVTAVKEGAYDYIRKPCKLEQIKIVVENAIDKIRLNRENRELLKKLQDAYHELVALKTEKQEDAQVSKMNFYSSNMPDLHYLFNNGSPPNNTIDKLQALSTLKKSGTLTESEFRVFKDHLLNKINPPR